MIQKSDGKIGSREVFVLVTFMISLKLSDMTPTLLFEEGKTATWMIPILAGAFMLLPIITIFSLLKKYKDKGLIQIVYILTGKYIGFIISILIFISLFLATVANSRDYVDVIQTMFLPETPRLAIYAVLMVAVYFIANRGLEVIGRTAWFIFPILTLILLVLIYMVTQDVDMSFIYPFWGPGIMELTRISAGKSSIVVDIILFTALFSYVRTYKDFKLPAIAGFVLSIAELAGFFMIYVVMNDYPAVANTMFPFHQITMMVHAGRYLINVEAFFFAFWIIASVVRYTIYLYLTVYIFAQSLRLKEFEPLLLPFSALMVMMGLIPDNLVESSFVYRHTNLVVSSWLLVPLPFLLWIISKIRGERTKC